MNAKITIDFGSDKSQILRGVAIIFMIVLHNGLGEIFKICVPIFTFLVGYGYAFAPSKDLAHAIKRSWHLLSHFWLILLGIFVPVAIWRGNWNPNFYGLVTNMFGLESELNWYSWYVYFYIFAMVVMIPASHLIGRYGVWACLGLTLGCFGVVGGIHLIPHWSDNIWIQAVHDCFLCSPVMFSGFYLAEGGGITRLKIKRNVKYAAGLIILIIASFSVRMLPWATMLDFIIVPIFCGAMVALFNLIASPRFNQPFIALGRESMNIWFIHALFATTVTAAVFAPLIMWVTPIAVRALIMILVSYFLGRIISKVYDSL